ncbi:MULTISPECIES: hypothetical protein [unclassified Variovorax]|uniref:hypothetical protein n=1 Tax=unclassified Variovorax TaxID=663243 RepID=UPI003F44ABC3
MLLAINTSQTPAPEPTGAGAIPVGPRDPLPPPDPMVNVPIRPDQAVETSTPGDVLLGQGNPGYETPNPGIGNYIVGTPMTPPIAGTVMMSESGSRLVVIASGGGSIHVKIDGANGPIEMVADVSQNGDQLVLSGLHVEGSGDNTSSLRELREAAREVGLAYGANEVLIRGGQRANGANPGHWPRDVIIRMKK